VDPAPGRIKHIVINYSAAIVLGIGCLFKPFTQSVGHLGLGISPSQGLYLHTGQHKLNKRKQTFMPRVGFEPTTAAAFELTKTVHAIDHAATVIGCKH
jgi:hypothetical protein